MKTAIIAGSTGAIGSELLSLLLDSSEYERVHCLVRRKLTFSHPKLVTHEINFDELGTLNLTEKNPELAHANVFCCLGTTLKQAGSLEAFKRIDKDYVLSVAKLAERLSASTFSLVSAIGANAASSQYYTQTKGEVELQVQQLNLPSIRIFRPSILHGKRSQFRFNEFFGFILLTLLSPILQGRLKKYRAISTTQVAKALYLTSLQSYDKSITFENDSILAL
ncbi:short chain dehydrogenase [Shewanella surugensis]|uniref:Short chain dehydrogenase n=1 Tax=Shewanella surugensis TaxID=212020 RepID=A0ABT0LBG4_9GAMM|nr:short chain dehydrogenase [Shewanella surugensis]MCL1124521.1 short chain dehydrogenase [Shewanella surugensis]